MSIEKEIIINAPIETVWSVVGDQFGSVSDWVSSIVNSEGTGPKTLSGAPCTGRVCQTTMGEFKETITHFDPERYEVAYSATGDKIPFFVQALGNRWELMPQGPKSTKVRMTMTLRMAMPFNILPGALMKLKFAQVGQDVLEELKVFTETGRPHTRKQKQINKTAA